MTCKVKFVTLGKPMKTIIAHLNNSYILYIVLRNFEGNYLLLSDENLHIYFIDELFIKIFLF